MDWTCSECTYINQSTDSVCQMCGYTNSASSSGVEHQSSSLQQTRQTSNWDCSACTYINRGHRRSCEICGSSRLVGGTSDFQQELPLQHEQPADLRSTISSVVSIDTERRLVIIGKTGSGKSTTCNNILERGVFKSDVCGESVTKQCQRATCDRFGRNIQLIDTPGLFDTGMTNAETTREITKCVGMSAPGPHAFVLILSVGRFTQEEQNTVEQFKNIFGEDMLKHLLVLFTKKDDLIHNGKTIEQYRQSVPKPLNELLESCGDRYIAFNNRGTPEERDRDVRDLMYQIDSIYLNNGGKCYTSEMYKEAEKALLKREEQLRKKHEEKVNREKMKIQKEFEKEIEQMEKAKAEEIAQLMEQVRIKEEDKEKEHELEKQKLELEREKMKMEKELEMEKRRVEMEAYKRKVACEAYEPQYREQVRQEVNEGQEMALHVLKLVGPMIFDALVHLGTHMIKESWSQKPTANNVKPSETVKENPTDDDKQHAKSPKDTSKDDKTSTSKDDDEHHKILT